MAVRIFGEEHGQNLSALPENVSLRPAYHELKKEIEDFQQARALQGVLEWMVSAKGSPNGWFGGTYSWKILFTDGL